MLGDARTVANGYLREVFVPDYNARFGKPAAEPGTAFVAYAGPPLADVLCVQAERQVGRELRAMGQVQSAFSVACQIPNFAPVTSTKSSELWTPPAHERPPFALDLQARTALFIDHCMYQSGILDRLV